MTTIIGMLNLYRQTANISCNRVESRNLVGIKLMSDKGWAKVNVICMDLSSGYQSIVRQCFPKAKIMADRFRVIRLVLYHFMEF